MVASYRRYLGEEAQIDVHLCGRDPHRGLRQAHGLRAEMSGLQVGDGKENETESIGLYSGLYSGMGRAGRVYRDGRRRHAHERRLRPSSEAALHLSAHEQACAMAAEAYARVDNRLAAVCVTHRPRSDQTRSPESWEDGWTPFHAGVSGQARYATTVPASGLPLRSMGVQECNIVPVVTPLTKYAVMVIRRKRSANSYTYKKPFIWR